MRTLRQTSARPLLLAISLAAAGCGGGDDASPPGTSDGALELRWQCTEDRGGWTLCHGDRILYCHAEIGSAHGDEPHFDPGRSCDGEGLRCVELDEATAGCVDPQAPCAAGEGYCEANVAYSCFEGQTLVTRCGVSRQCVEDEGDASCQHARGDE